MPDGEAPAPAPAAADVKKKKKKGKVRSARISFNLALARHTLAWALLLQGKPDAAIAVGEKVPDPVDADTLSTLSVAHIRAGNRARGDALFKQLLARQPQPVAPLARWYAAAGDRSAALDTLERAQADGPRSIQPLMSDPIFDSVRSDARFVEIARRAKAGTP